MTLLQLNTELLNCRRCPRLVKWREKVAFEKKRAYRNWIYWGKPVPGFGDPKGRVFVVGLAPGAHGSNRTGRQFTGDASGEFLFAALFRAGFASQPTSNSRYDGLILTDLYTAPVCRCVPPDNKPTLQEMSNCQPYLEYELELIHPKVLVALGRIAFERVLRMYSVNDASLIFMHNNTYKIQSDQYLVCSYHPSRQNTQTGRLTVGMFDQVWNTVLELLKR
jgi:uracil-DNA glycosylase family 4